MMPQFDDLLPLAPIVLLVSVDFDGKTEQRYLPASEAVMTLRMDPDNGRRWFRRWIYAPDIDMRQWE